MLHTCICMQDVWLGGVSLGLTALCRKKRPKIDLWGGSNGLSTTRTLQVSKWHGMASKQAQNIAESISDLALPQLCH